MQEQNMHESFGVERVASSANIMQVGKKNIHDTVFLETSIQGETDYVILVKTSVKVGKRTDDVPGKRTKCSSIFISSEVCYDRRQYVE
jgi:hypothetical protein